MSTKREEKVIDKSIDETKESARKVLTEVKRELPEVTSTFHDYQEQNINAVREMTNTFLESQKEAAKAMQSAFRPYYTNTYLLMFWPWTHPEVMTRNYLQAVSSITESSIATARTSSDITQIAMESMRTSIDAAKENTKAVSRYILESARAFENASDAETSGSNRR